MNDIAKAFSNYTNLLASFAWLKETGQLPAETNIGELAVQGALANEPLFVMEAFVAAMEIAQTARNPHTTSPGRTLSLSEACALSDARQAKVRETYAKARKLASESVR